MKYFVFPVMLWSNYVPRQIRDDLCAVLYDEEKCKKSEDFLELRNGDQGVLPLLTTGLRRNDVEVFCYNGDDFYGNY